MQIMTRTNGAAEMMAACCRLSSPPARRRIAAAAPARAPQTTTTALLGSRMPLEESMPITIAPASAPLIKNRATRTTAMRDISAASGNWLRVANSATAGLSATASAMLPPRELQVYGRPSENTEPHEGNDARDHEHAEDELTDRAALRDQGNKNPNERGAG